MKIFINDKPLVFSSNGNSANLPEINEDISFEKVSELFGKEECKGAQIKSANADDAFKKFSKQLIVLEAAGGVVYNYEEKILLIQRFGKWDLPKGKIERIETPKHAAMREVCEETGVCDLEIISALPLTYHTYEHKGKNLLKRTYWFKMQCNSFTNFALQKEEDITDAAWMSKEEMKEAMKNSYASINDLMSSIL